ncbi:MAG: hypothetical protein II729_01540, partial [Ruminococcus sp.]|nr:hypothetical protein [Ruminococcus sp.]
MEQKKHMLRKTAAFAAALSFLSATNLNILNSAAESSTVKKQAIASTVKELNNNVSSAQSEQTPSAGTTKSTTTTTTTTSTTTTTTTTTTTVPVTKSTEIHVNIDVNGDFNTKNNTINNLTDHYASELQKNIAGLSPYISVGTKSSSWIGYPHDTVTITYPEKLEGTIKNRINNLKVEKIENETYYAYGYSIEHEQWEYKRYYKLDDHSDYVSFNIPNTNLKIKGNDSYVSEDYEFSDKSFTVEKREYYLDDFHGIKPTGKVTLNYRTINLNGKEHKVNAAKVTITLNLKNCNIDNKDKMTYTFEWQELDSKYVNITADNANNLIINDKLYTNMSNQTTTLSLKEILEIGTSYYEDNDFLPDGKNIQISVYASLKTIKAEMTFLVGDSNAEYEDLFEPEHIFTADSYDNIYIPYIISKDEKIFFLQRKRVDVNGIPDPKRSVSFSSTEICNILFSDNSSISLPLGTDEIDSCSLRLEYREFPDTESIDSDPLIELFANSLNGTINDDVIFAKRPAPAGEDNKRTISLNLPGYAGHEIIIVDDDNNSSSVTVKADASNAAVGKAVYEVKDDTKFVKVVLVKKIGNKDVPVDTQPFFVYFDDHQPEIKVKNNPNKWSNENNYKIDFTVNDEDDLSSVHPLFYADAEKIKKLEELKAIKYISILEQKGRSDAPLITYEHRFNIPDGIDDTVGQYTLSEAASQEGKNELNVKLIKQLDEDEKPYFTAEFSMADSEAKGYRGHV